MPKTVRPSQGDSLDWKKRVRELYLRIKSLQGEPHYVAMGMAVGVFVAFTPTIPFHTILTIALAFVFRGSKPAALIGSWLNNPLTLPAFYYGSYKMGVLLLGHRIPEGLKIVGIKGLIDHGWDVAGAMIAGGALLGILPAAGAYFLTFRLFRRIRRRHTGSLLHSSRPIKAPGHETADAASSKVDATMGQNREN